MKKKPLEQFEEIAQRLVEGSLGRLFGGRLDPLEISAELARAIDANQKDGLAPNQYVVQLHPADYSYMRHRWPEVTTVLIHYVVQITKQLHLELATDPTVELVASPDIARHYAHVHAEHKKNTDGTTQLFTPVRQYDPLEALKLLDAFLIINGRTHLELDRTQLTLGRRSDCDVMIDDGTVSRRHAQIRWRFGRFIVYDLGSRAGTYVNDQRIDEFVLRAGDVVRIGETTFIYGEGNPDNKPSDPKTNQTGHTVQFTPPQKPE